MPSGENPIDDLAGAVLDGSVVDWAAAEANADAALRLLLQDLRVVASIAQVYRDVLPAERTGAAAAPAESMLDQWGSLRLLERIGRGAFGEVFRAWDPRLDREVALKLMPAPPSSDSDGGSSIIREGRLLAKVRHPNVVTIYGAEQIGDRIGLSMELVRGQTLEQQIKQGTTFGTRDVIGIGVELCRAVSAVHAAGLLHRDIKAQNVTRAEDGRVVLMDFGAGSELNDSSADVAGTPLYLAPEVLAGAPATVQSDVYSLGVLLYHLLTGSFPVGGHSVREVREAHERGERVVMRRARSDVRPALARAIDRACDPRPERRYADADAFARDVIAARRHPAAVALRYGLGTATAVFLVALVASEGWARLSPGHTSVRRRLVGAIAGRPSPLAHPVIAVLPFKNLGSATGSDLLVDSLTTGLIRQLGVIDGLQVRSQESSFRVSAQDLADVGRRLSVNLVIQGDARVSADKLVVNAALHSVADGSALWSSTVDRELKSEGDVVAVTEELARTIVNRLRLKLGPTQRRYDTDIPTLQMYLKARALRDARGQRGVESIALFEEVIRRDPSYAPAKAALAAMYGEFSSVYPYAEFKPAAGPMPVQGGIRLSEAIELMEPLTRSALEIDPLLAQAHAAQGFVHAMMLRWTEAEASFRRAIEVEPNCTSLYGDFVLSVLLPWGRVDESLTLLQNALDADPESLDLLRTLTYAQLSAGQYEAARDNARRVLSVDPTFPHAGDQLRWALLFNGERAEALALLEEFADGGPGIPGGGPGIPGGRPSIPGGRPGVPGYIHAINGRRAEAEAIAAKFGHIPQRQAEIYGLLGDKDRALEALERLAALNPVRAARYLNHPEIGLRGDPRAETFRRKLGFH